MRNDRGVTLVELAVVVAILTLGIGLVAPVLGDVLPGLRLQGATAELYGALHATRARAEKSGVIHAFVVEADGRGFRIVADPTGASITVEGPQALVDGVMATANAAIRFTPRGYAVPAGTITVRSGEEARRVIVNILGRVRIAPG